ncbi:hypothetical protein D083_1455 [Dickeya solani RNS 08.23.3.1.A]|nr:hypothetical protein D083_1455 [Dickeya solani RNS 08.23.3.1.A]
MEEVVTVRVTVCVGGNEPNVTRGKENGSLSFGVFRPALIFYQ